MIKLEHVSKYYTSGPNVAMGLNDVSCELKKGEIIAIVGESGSGKSTFLNVVSAIDSFEDGEIYYENEPVTGMTIEELEGFRKNHIGFIFQNYNIIDSYTVLQNVMLPLLIRGKSQKEAKESALDIINKVGLSHRIKNRGSKLSGGEKQRCVIARALASDSDIISCDEPTGNLDSKTGADIINLIKSISKDRLVLIVTHNYDEIKDIATRIIRFHDGRIVEDKNISQVSLSDDKLTPNREFKFGFKHQFILALRNTFATPKKLIFTFLVFFVVVLIWGYLFSNSLTSAVEDNLYYSYYSYANLIEDRMVVYNIDKSELDKDEIIANSYGSNIIYNSFYEDYQISSIDGAYCYLGANITSTNIGTIQEGTAPSNDSEIAIGVNSNLIYRYTDYIGESISFINGKSYKITGIFSYYENQSNIFVYGSDVFKEEIKEEIFTNYINFKSLNSSIIPFLIDENVAFNNINVSTPYNDLESSHSLSIEMNNTYLIDTDEYNIVYSKGSENFPLIKLSSETFKTMYEDNIFQVSIYNSELKNQKNIEKDIENLGYVLEQVATVSSQGDIITVIMNSFFKVLSIGSSIIVMIILFFLSYLVLSKIFSSKSKDYTILRTLGLTKADMRQTVIIETELTIVLALLVFGLMQFVSFVVLKKLFITQFSLMDAWGITIYIIVMLIFGLLFADRSNRKIYKLTVQSTIKKEVIEND